MKKAGSLIYIDITQGGENLKQKESLGDVNKQQMDGQAMSINAPMAHNHNSEPFSLNASQTQRPETSSDPQIQCWVS